MRVQNSTIDGAPRLERRFLEAEHETGIEPLLVISKYQSLLLRPQCLNGFDVDPQRSDAVAPREDTDDDLAIVGDRRADTSRQHRTPVVANRHGDILIEQVPNEGATRSELAATNLGGAGDLMAFRLVKPHLVLDVDP